MRSSQLHGEGRKQGQGEREGEDVFKFNVPP